MNRNRVPNEKHSNRHPMKMTRSYRTVLLLSVLIILAGLAGPDEANAADPDSLHWASWDTTLAAAESEPAVRYAFYAYRTLLVPHPEVYLQADSLFAEIVESMPGSRAAYRSLDVRDVPVFHRMQEDENPSGHGQSGHVHHDDDEGEKPKRPSFMWRLWAPSLDSVVDVPITQDNSWLDRRLPPAAILLRTQSKILSSAEVASLRYTKSRRNRTPADQLFVVIDTGGRGYLSRDGQIQNILGATISAADCQTISPLLVFNERVVYYPLFNRDDRSISDDLSQTVAALGPSVPLEMTATERQRVERLATVASLPTDDAKSFAVIAALGAMGVRNSHIEKAWRNWTREDGLMPVGYERGLVWSAMYWANRLSKRTARLVASVLDLPSDSIIHDLSAQYLDLAGRLIKSNGPPDGPREAFGYLWGAELFDYSIDDIVRTRAGRGSSQGLAMGAILDLVGIPNVRLEILGLGIQRPDQLWVMLADGRWQYNLGRWTYLPPDLAAASREAFRMGSYGIGSDWTNLWYLRTYSPRDGLQIASDFSEIKRITPGMALYLPIYQGATIHLVEFQLRVAGDDVTWKPLPWPKVEP